MDASMLLEKIKDSRFLDSNGEITDALPIVEAYAQEVAHVALMNEAEKRKELHKILKTKSSLDREHFIACLDDGLIKVIPLMQLEEAGLVMRLLAYLSVEDGILKDNNGYIHNDDIIRIAGKPKRTVQRYIKNLVDIGVLVKAGTSNKKTIYAFNPSIHSRKGHSKGYFTKIWLTNLREKWSSLPLDTLGFLYRIVPYFNTYSCCLSVDPYEYDVARSQPFPMSTLEFILGMDIKDIRKHVNLLSRKSLIIKIDSGRSTILCVSPQIMYRKAVLDGECVPNDTQLIYKQASMVADSIDEILAYRRAIKKVDGVEE